MRITRSTFRPAVNECFNWLEFEAALIEAIQHDRAFTVAVWHQSWCRSHPARRGCPCLPRLELVDHTSGGPVLLARHIRPTHWTSGSA